MTLTNVLCNIIITLLTNTVETDNSSGCKSYHPYHLVLNHVCMPSVAATEKTVTTTVTERVDVKLPPQLIAFDSIKGNFEADQINIGTITRDRELSRTVKRYVKSQEWVEVKTLEVPSAGFATNTMQFKTHYPSNIMYLDPWIGFDIVKATNDLARWGKIMEDFIDGLRKIGEQKEPK